MWRISSRRHEVATNSGAFRWSAGKLFIKLHWISKALSSGPFVNNGHRKTPLLKPIVISNCDFMDESDAKAEVKLFLSKQSNIGFFKNPWPR